MKPTMLVVTTILLSSGLVPVAYSADDNPMEKLYFLVGDWQGRTTLHFPGRADRTPVDEAMHLSCEKVFTNGSIVRCQAMMETATGNQREWVASFSYHDEEKQYYVTYQYNNYPNVVRFPFKLLEDGSGFLGFVTEENEEGAIIPVERIEWAFSSDRRKVAAHEYYDVTEDGTVNYQLGFDFEIEKVNP